MRLSTIANPLIIVQIRLRPEFKKWDIFWDTKLKKWPTDTCEPLFSGEDEIRTRGTVNPYVSLANWWFQPLTHLSGNAFLREIR